MDSHNVLDDPESLEKPASKLRRSCEFCRASKGRCAPSKNDINGCERCEKEKKPCVFLEAKARQKRAKNSRTRVAEMEQRLDKLYNLLSSAGRIRQEAVNTPPQESPLPHPEVQSSDFIELLTTCPTPSSRTATSRTSQVFPIWSFPYMNFDDIQDVISNGVVTFERAEESLALFRSKACNFPFILVSSETSLDSLRREQPFLLLSILAFGARGDYKLQDILELELRETLSRKVIVDCEKSMDLLQGVLVYLCWYHCYFQPDREQIYQLTQMAAAMAVDLGINRMIQNTSQFSNCSIQYATPPVPVPRKLSKETDNMRTFLGCYYLSSSICLFLRRPNILKYDEYIEDCCQGLAQTSLAESDYLLPCFISLQRIAEKANLAFDYNSALQDPQLDSLRVEILAKSFTLQLDQLRSTFPQNIWNNIQLDMSYRTLRIYLNEVGFHASPPSPLELSSGPSNLRAWYYSAARNESLIACLQAAKDYLDRFIEIPSYETLNFTFPDYLRLVYAVLILWEFTTGCDCPMIDSGHLRKTANLGYYLDALIGKAENLLSITTEQERINFVYHLRLLWMQSKNSYNQAMNDPSSAIYSHIKQSKLSFMELLPSVHGCSIMVSDASECDEKWMGVLPHWPTSLDPSMISMNLGLRQ